MVGKGGFLRIAEALLSAVIVIVFLILLSKHTETGKVSFESEAKILLDEAAKNEDLRGKVLANSPGVENDLESFVRGKINNPALNFSVRVCEINMPCGLRVYPAGSVEIYAAERVISTNRTSQGFAPKIVKLFIWGL